MILTTVNTPVGRDGAMETGRLQVTGSTMWIRSRVMGQ